MDKKIQEMFDKSLEKLSADLEKGYTEKIAEIQTELSAVSAQLSAKEVSDANKMTGVSKEAMTVFGAYAKTIMGKSVSAELSEKVVEFKDAIEKDVIIGTDASGQDLLHTQLHKGILALAETYGVFVRDAKALTATEGLYKMVFENVPGDNGSWIDEGAVIPQDKITFGQRTVTMKTWRKMIGVSEQMLKNSAPADLGQYLIATLAKKFGLFIEGVGFTAVLASTGVVQVTAEDASFGVSGLTALSYNDLVDIQTSVPASVAGRAKWYMSPSVLGAVKKVVDGAGSPIFAYGNGNFQGGNLNVDGIKSAGSILDKAVEISDALPSVADITSQKDFLIYGDLSEAFAVITRTNFRVESNNGGKYFEQGIVAVRGTADANVAEVLPGAVSKAQTKA